MTQINNSKYFVSAFEHNIKSLPAERGTLSEVKDELTNCLSLYQVNLEHIIFTK